MAAGLTFRQEEDDLPGWAVVDPLVAVVDGLGGGSLHCFLGCRRNRLAISQNLVFAGTRKNDAPSLFVALSLSFITAGKRAWIDFGHLPKT